MVMTREPYLGRALGWFSVGLGLANLCAPRSVARGMGLPESSRLLRLAGAREVLTGVGLLAAPEAAAWRWARVAGDVMDLAALGLAARADGADRSRLGRSAMAVAGVTAIDLAAAASGKRPPAKGPPRAVVTVGRSPEECYRAWKDVETMRRSMSFVDTLEAAGGNRLRWSARGLRWTSELTDDVPGRRIAWRILPGGDVEGTGSLTFRPAPKDLGCVLTLEMRMSKPRLLEALKAKTDLLRFKQLVETGTIPTTAGQSSGRRSPLAKVVEKGEAR